MTKKGENFVSFDLFSTIQDLSFDVLKLIFGKLLSFSSKKGISKKYEIYQKMTLRKNFSLNFFFLEYTTHNGKILRTF